MKDGFQVSLPSTSYNSQKLSFSLYKTSNEIFLGTQVAAVLFFHTTSLKLKRYNRQRFKASTKSLEYFGNHKISAVISDLETKCIVVYHCRACSFCHTLQPDILLSVKVGGVDMFYHFKTACMLYNGVSHNVLFQL